MIDSPPALSSGSPSPSCRALEPPPLGGQTIAAPCCAAAGLSRPGGGGPLRGGEGRGGEGRGGEGRGGEGRGGGRGGVLHVYYVSLFNALYITERKTIHKFTCTSDMQPSYMYIE